MIPSHRAPTHPREMLLDEFLRPLGLSQVDAAERMGMSLNRLNELIRGKRGVTGDTALRLAQLWRRGFSPLWPYRHLGSGGPRRALCGYLRL